MSDSGHGNGLEEWDTHSLVLASYSKNAKMVPTYVNVAKMVPDHASISKVEREFQEWHPPALVSLKATAPLADTLKLAMNLFHVWSMHFSICSFFSGSQSK